jgi:hypothetical protein
MAERFTRTERHSEPASPWTAFVPAEAERSDVLRRIARKAKGIETQGAVVTVTMPNAAQIRVTLDAAGAPLKWERMR